MSGLRDSVLLALGFSGAFRRPEFTALDVSDLAFARTVPRVTVRRSKTDQESAGQEITIPHGRPIKPVESSVQICTAYATRTCLGINGASPPADCCFLQQ